MNDKLTRPACGKLFPESRRYASFVERTGGGKTWEVEALPPDYLQKQVRTAIEANMDMDLYRQTIEQENQDCDELHEIRRDLAGALDVF